MTRRALLLTIGIHLFVLLAIAPAWGADGSWWPWGKAKTTAAPKKTTSSSTWSSTSSTANSSSKSSKSWTDSLTPWKKPAEKKPVPYGNLGRPASSAKKEPEKTSGFANLFMKKEEPQPPKTLNEWMQLQRIDP